MAPTLLSPRLLLQVPNDLALFAKLEHHIAEEAYFARVLQYYAERYFVLPDDLSFEALLYIPLEDAPLIPGDLLLAMQLVWSARRM